jgi:hypothetical protein
MINNPVAPYSTFFSILKLLTYDVGVICICVLPSTGTSIVISPFESACTTFSPLYEYFRPGASLEIPRVKISLLAEGYKTKSRS